MLNVDKFSLHNINGMVCMLVNVCHVRMRMLVFIARNKVSDPTRNVFLTIIQNFAALRAAFFVFVFAKKNIF